MLLFFDFFQAGVFFLSVRVPNGGRILQMRTNILSIYSATPPREDYVHVCLRLTVTVLSVRKRKKVDDSG